MKTNDFLIYISEYNYNNNVVFFLQCNNNSGCCSNVCTIKDIGVKICSNPENSSSTTNQQKKINFSGM